MRGWERTRRSPQGFGKEFMPPLNEGSLLYMPVMMPKTGLKEIQRVMSWQDTVIAATCPRSNPSRASWAASKPPTDPAPTEMLETTIMLKPEYIPRWPLAREAQSRVA
jgi:Cu(I)/Ag(I) efflux system membrane protein CusA/SilA